MYEGSEKYFLGILKSRALYLYGAGSGVSTSIQLLLINVGLLGQDLGSPETIASFIEKWVFVALPILPPYSIVDVVNFLINLIFAGLIAYAWTVKWSEGMAGYHGR